MSNLQKEQNQSLASILKNSLLAIIGLFGFGVGVYLSIQANIGVAPWDTFYLGLSQAAGVQYGNISIAASVIIILIDVLILKQQIGIGTLLDAVVVGKTVDLLNWLNLLPAQQNMLIGVVLMVISFFIMGFSQYLYMQAGLSCGPRDSLLVGINMKIPKVKVGYIGTAVLITVFIFGWLLDGPIGIGTVLAVALQGTLMQVTFNILKFDPKTVVHQNLVQSMKVIFGK